MSGRGQRKQYQKISKEEEWIEMEDLNQPRNVDMSKRFAQIQGKQYIPPKRQIQYQNENITHNQSSPFNNPKPLGNRQNEPPRSKPKNKKPPSLPMMEATCDFCTVVQLVPGNTQVFICGSCQNMNQCYPLYGVASCGNCQAMVGFGFGTSTYVKCPKCASIISVPIEPVKNYDSTGQTMSHISQPPEPPFPPKSQQQQKQPQDLLYPEIKPEMYGKEYGQDREVQRGEKMQGYDSEELDYVGVERQKREQFD